MSDRKWVFSTSAPEARLDRKVFDPGPDPARPVPRAALYRCPRCHAVVQFRTLDFDRHLGSGHSNLPQDAQEEWSRVWPPPGREPGESFLDFACPGCGMPVWIVFRPWEHAEGGRGYTVTEVVEGREEDDRAAQ